MFMSKWKNSKGQWREWDNTSYWYSFGHLRGFWIMEALMPPIQRGKQSIVI